MTSYRSCPYSEYEALPGLRSHQVIDYTESPRLYRDRCDGIIPAPGPSMLFGIAGHMAVLERERYFQLREIEPTLYPSAKGEDKPWTYAANYCKAWRAEREAAGKIVVSVEDDERLTAMHLRMPAEVVAMFSGGSAEAVVTATIHETPCKARVDLLHVAARKFYEFKTIRNINAIDKTIARLGYHIQLRFYAQVLRAASGDRYDGRLVFAETQAPYRWRVVELDLDYIALGDRAIADALAGIAARTKSGCWDDPEPLHYLASPPAWMDTDDMDDSDDEEVA